MSNLKSIASTIEAKIGKLVDLHQSTKKNLTVLKAQNETLKNAVEEQKKAIKELIDKGKVLKISKSLSTNNENTTELKLKINELIREVDKCISLLNK